MFKSNRLLKNIFTNWLSLFLNILISFVIAPIVVNSLGSIYYGIWVIMMQFTGYLYLMDFGIRESVIRSISKYSAEDKENKETDISKILSASLIMYSSIAPICLVASIIVAYFFPDIFTIPENTIDESRLVVLLTGLTLAQFFIFNIYSGIVMGLQRYDIFNKVTIVLSIIRAITIVYLLKSGYGIVALATNHFIISLVGNLVIRYYSKQLTVSHNIPFFFKYVSYGKNKDTYKSIFNYSFFVMINNLGQKVIFHTDAIIIGIFLPASSITFYAIAGTLADYMVKLCVTATFVLNPVASEFDTKNDTSKIREIIYIGCKLSVLMTIPICCVYLTMGKTFIGLWMGEDFSIASGEILIILALLHLFSLPHHTISSVLYGISKHHYLAYLKIAEALTNLVLSIILVQHFGLFGVAFGTVIPHLISVLIVIPLIIRMVLKINLMRYFYGSYFLPIVSALPFLFACYYVNDHYTPESLLGLFSSIAILMPAFIIPAWFIAFTKMERLKYREVLLNFVSKMNK